MSVKKYLVTAVQAVRGKIPADASVLILVYIIASFACITSLLSCLLEQQKWLVLFSLSSFSPLHFSHCDI